MRSPQVWFAVPWWVVLLSTFSGTFWPFVCLLWEMVCSGPLPIFKLDCLGVFLLLNYMSSLYVLDIHPLSDRWLANIFSWFTGCLFIWLLHRSYLVWYSLTCWFLLSLPLFRYQAARKIRCQDWCQGTFSLCFRQGVWQFQIIHLSM